MSEEQDKTAKEMEQVAMEKNKVQNDKVQPDDEICDKDLDRVAGGGVRMRSHVYNEYTVEP